MKAFLIALTLTAPLLLAGCGGGGGTTTTPAPAMTNAPSAAPAQAVVDASTSAALDAQTDATDTAASLSVADPIDPGLQGLSIRRAEASPTPNPCVNVSPLPIVDANHNGIPDNETWTYTNCSRPGPVGSTETLNGKVNITDTSQGATTSWVRTVTNLTDTQTTLVLTFTDVLNGSSVHTLTNNSTVETVTRNFTNQLTGSLASGLSGSVSTNVSENILFTSAFGVAILPLKNPPSGTLILTGTRKVITQIGSATPSTTAYAISTPSVLFYDATCTTPPRLTSGSLQMTNTTSNKTVTLKFTGCGILPIVTKS